VSLSLLGTATVTVCRGQGVVEEFALFAPVEALPPAEAEAVIVVERRDDCKSLLLFKGLQWPPLLLRAS